MSLIERVARALMEVDFGTMGDEEQERWMAKPLGDEFRRRARAAIDAMPQLDAMQAEMERLREALESFADYAQCQVNAFSSGRPYLDLTGLPYLIKEARASLETRSEK